MNILRKQFFGLVSFGLVGCIFIFNLLQHLFAWFLQFLNIILALITWLTQTSGMMSSVHMSTFGRLLQVPTSVVAYKAHKLGAMFTVQMLADSNVNERLKRLSKEAVTFTTKLNAELIILSEELI